MNAAVGGNICPPWMCIESKEYAELFKHQHAPRSRKTDKANKAGWKYLVIAPNGKRTTCRYATDAGKVIGKQAAYIAALLKDKPRHKFRNGWVVERAAK